MSTLTLPVEGIVENGDGRVVVRRLDGSVATELLSMRVDDASSPARPPRLVASDGRAFRVLHRRLRPDQSPIGDVRFSGDGPRPTLSPPPVKGVGHWRYAFGDAATPTLAQWSGECELPVAYEVVSGRLVGLGASGAPIESVALGVSLVGDPVVLFPRTGCGIDSGRLGVYVRDSSGEWQRVTAALSARYFRG